MRIPAREVADYIPAIKPQPKPAVVAQTKPLVVDADEFTPAPTAVAKPKPLQVDGFEKPAAVLKPAVEKPAPVTTQQAVDAAPVAYMQEVLRQAGVPDDVAVNLDDAALRDAFKQVLTGADKLGRRSITLDVRRSETDPSGEGSNTRTWTERETFSFDVKAKGVVGDLKLDRGAITQAVKQAEQLPRDVLAQTLSQLGAPGAGPELLATAQLLAKTPGRHTLSWSEAYTTGGGDGDTRTEYRTQTLSFESNKKGVITVDGKPLERQQAIDLSGAISQMSLEKKQDELIAAGFPPDTVKRGSNEDLHAAMVRLSEELVRPGGPREFEAAFGGDDHKVRPHKDASGKFDGFEIEVKPKKKSGWKKFTDGLKKIAGPVLTVLSFIPVTAPFAAIANAALGVYNGIKNKNPLAIIAGIAGGIGGFATAVGDAALGGLASAANTVGRIASTAGQVMSAIKDKNPGSFLGLLAGAAGFLADHVGDGANGLADTLRGLQSTAAQGQQLAGVVDAVRNRDVGALIGLGAGAVLGGETQGEDGVDREDAYEPVDESDGLDFPPGPGPVDFDGPTARNVAASSVPYTVERGETLSRIAQQQLDDAGRWPELYAWNADVLTGGPNRLQPGMQLELPPADFRLSDEERAQIIRDGHLPTATVPNDGLDARDLGSRGRFGAPETAPVVPVAPGAVDHRELYNLGKSFDQVLDQMTADGRRIGGVNGAVNNLIGTGQVLGAAVGLDFDPVAGCHGQAIEMASAFKTSLRAQFKGWSFEPISNFPLDAGPEKYLPGSGYHWVIEARSPSGHRYMLDPNNGHMDAWRPEHDAFRYK